jgi:hypothetical protein
MKNIQIEVSKAALKKMDAAGIRYKITNSDVDLEKLLTSHTDVSELNDYELSKIVNEAKKAIDKGTKYGIAIETRSGRDMNDHRCYSLDEVFIVLHDDGDCRHTVDELMKGG